MGHEKGLICFVSGTPAGSVRFYSNDGLYFRRLAVLPEYRGRGLSKRMVMWLEEYASRNGEKRIWCNTRASIQRNMNLYISMGFKVIDQWFVERKGHDVLVATLSKSLKQ